MINPDSFVYYMEKLLILKGSEKFEKIPELYYELAKNLTHEDLEKVINNILINEEYFPYPKLFKSYVDDIISKKVKRTIMYCNKCNLYYEIKIQANEEVKNYLCFKCNNKIIKV